MAQARVARHRLERVGDRVAEVQHLPPPAVALVLRDDRELRARAVEDHVVVDGLAGADAVPQRPAGDQRRLDDLGVPGGELLRRQRRERLRVHEDRRRLVVGADVVLGLGEVDPGLAAVGRVDLRDERRRHLDDRDPALERGGAEAREVADDAAADRHEVVGARHALVHERAPHRLGGRERLLLLPRGDLDEPGEHRHAAGVEIRDVLVADDEAPRGRRQRPRGRDRAGAEPHRVVARRARRPQQPQALRLAARERRERGQRVPHDVAARARQRRVRGGVVGRTALGEQRVEGGAVACQRAPAAGRARPRGLEVHLDEDDGVRAQRLADPLASRVRRRRARRPRARRPAPRGPPAPRARGTRPRPRAPRSSRWTRRTRPSAPRRRRGRGRRAAARPRRRTSSSRLP